MAKQNQPSRKNGAKSSKGRSQFAQGAAQFAKRTLSSPAAGGLLSGLSTKVPLIGKLAEFGGKAAPFLPGPLGAGVKLLSGLFGKNDPSWWPDEAGSNKITLNTPLIAGVEVTTGVGISGSQMRPCRLTIGDGVTTSVSLSGPSTIELPMTIDTEQVTRFVLSNVRKVVNAVSLRPAAEYTLALNVAGALRAVYSTINRILYEAANPLENMPEQAIRLILQSDQLPMLNALKQRIESVFVTGVKLPLTLVDYIDWRYGYNHRINGDEKSALVVYMPLVDAVTDPNLYSADDFATYTENLLSLLASVSQAAVDLREAFKDHPQTPTPGTMSLQYTYDPKEYAARANLFAMPSRSFNLDNKNLPVYIPTGVDKDTTFVASTVSAPDDKIPVYSISNVPSIVMRANRLFHPRVVRATIFFSQISVWNSNLADALAPIATKITSRGTLAPDSDNTRMLSVDITSLNIPNDATAAALKQAILVADLAQALEYHNADYLTGQVMGTDRIALSYMASNMGVINPTVLRGVHDHAVQCLTRDSRKSHTTEVRELAAKIEDVTGAGPATAA